MCTGVQEAYVGDRCRGDPCIVQLLDAFKLNESLHLVYEHAGQDLSKRDNLDPTSLRGGFHSVLVGLGYVHSLGLMHADVKPANILVDGSGKFRLGDLGSTLEASPSNIVLCLGWFLDRLGRPGGPAQGQIGLGTKGAARGQMGALAIIARTPKLSTIGAVRGCRIAAGSLVEGANSLVPGS